MSKLYAELTWRGLVYDATRDTEDYLTTAESPAAYAGFDPTARSLHIGSLVPIMGLVHVQRHGGHPIALLGGGTGMVGDPSGKSEEREFLSPDRLAENLSYLRTQLSHFLDFTGPGAAQLVDNLEWLGKLHLMDFLRDIGKYYTVNQMLAKESIRVRLERAREGAEGISYTEFTYMLMQAYDFLHLFDNHGCRFQLGGSDQWGNITAGIELISRMRGERSFGLVMPLITTASGQKFGKSEQGNVWLDAEMTSPYRFYQYWINTEDADVERYLKFFTLHDQKTIATITAEHHETPHKRTGQIALAEDITRRVHGDAGLEAAQTASRALFGGDLGTLSAADLADVFGDVPSVDLADVADGRAPFTAVELAVWSGLAKSKGEARRLIQSGGMYVNNERVGDFAAEILKVSRLHERYLVLRKGNKSYFLVTWDRQD
jgi:tyrosyl-tRNA synthetase